MDEDEDEDEDDEDEDKPTNGEDAEDGSQSSDDDEEDDENENSDNEEVDEELRQRILEALSVNGIKAANEDDEDSEEEEYMDDDQMMAIDEHLAEVFRSRVNEKKASKGMSFRRSLIRTLVSPTKYIRSLYRSRRTKRSYAFQKSGS